MKISKLPAFHLIWMVYLIPIGFCLLFFEKGEFLLWLNANHHPSLDLLFLFLNALGEPLFITLMGLFLIAYRLGNVVPYVLVILINSLLVQTLKRKVFGPVDRPAAFFENSEALNQVGGHELLQQFSFPSGHASIAFAIFSMSCLLISDKRWQLLSLTLASGAALARVYLNQHFLQDIYFGSMVGVMASSIAFLLANRIDTSIRSELKNYSLINRIFKRAR